MSSDEQDKGPCWFCSRRGDLVARKGEDRIREDVFVCPACKKLLQRPETALPLIRGRITLEHRDEGARMKRRINRFMESISTWKPRN